MMWAFQACSCTVPERTARKRTLCSAELQQERDITFQPGRSFYRPQSTFSRDLACLSAQLHRQELGSGLSVLDLMAGSGVRGMRYLQHADADSVWCNDVSPQSHDALVTNLSASLGEARSMQCSPPVEAVLPLLDQAAWDWHAPGSPVQAGAGPGPAARLTHEEASRLLMWCALNRHHFDLIDIDSFGGDASFIGLALGALRRGGLICLTSTAGPLVGGRDPTSALSMYGVHLAPVPHANEQGLRLLLGVACKEALARSLQLTPLWSLYSPHGPVYRVMIRVEKAAGRQAAQHTQQQYGFVLHDTASGEGQVVGWDGLGGLHRFPSGPGPPPLLSGPLWVGPLQNGPHLTKILALAEQRGWAGRDSSTAAAPWTKKGGVRSLGELLQLLIAESDPRLPPWFLRMDDVGKVGRLSGPPPRDALVAELQSRGFAACATHIDSKAFRTSATMSDVITAWLARQDVCTPAVG